MGKKKFKEFRLFKEYYFYGFFYEQLKEKVLEKGLLYWINENGRWRWKREKIGKVKYFYDGYIKNNLPHQIGEIQYESKNIRYKGNFKNGKFHGLGEFVSTKGEKHEGVWNMGKLIQTQFIPEN